MLSVALIAFLPSSAFPAPLLAQDEPAPPPEPSGLLVREPGAFDGYTLFAPLRSGHTFLIDLAGEIVHDWAHGLPTMSNYLLDNGHLLTISRLDDNPVFFGGGIGGRITEYDWDGAIVWDYVLSDEKRITHHDVELLPNGHLLAITWEHHNRDQAAALGRDPDAVGDPGWWPDAVIEIEPTRPKGAKIVWEWRMSDHLIQDFDREKPGYGSPADRPERIDVNFDIRPEPAMTPEQRRAQKEREKAMRELGYTGGDGKPVEAGADDEDPKSRARKSGDWTHVNSVDYHAELDLILLSSPRLDELFVIDHSTTTEQARGSKGGRWGKGGDLLYRWGNPRNWGAGTDEDRQLFGQHQPEWIPAGLPGAGNVLVFNNGSERPGVEHSSVDELVLPLDQKRGFTREPNKAFGPAAPVWSYAAQKREEFFSFFISGCQRLANGNTLICSGQQGRLFEVTPGQRIVWEFWNPWGGELAHTFGKADPNKDENRPSPVRPTSVFRATRIAPSHPGLAGRKLEPVR